MKKFNKNIKAGITKVKLSYEDGYRLVSKVHETRKWIEIDGLVGSFPVGNIQSYTNKENVKMEK